MKSILEEAKEMVSDHYRLGQAVFNIAFERHPEVFDAMDIETFWAIDPYHNDERIPAFLEKINEQ